MLVSAVELGGWLKEHAGQNRICSITTLTPVKMVVKHRITKEPNPWLMQGESIVDHLQERLTAFGADYEAAVNRVWVRTELVDEDGFVPYFVAESLWRGAGERINNYMARHKETGQEYLVYLQAIRGDKNISLRQEMYLNRFTSSPVKLEDIQPYMVGSSASKKQRIEETGVEIAPRTIHIENVIRLRSFDLINHNDFQVIDINREPGQISV